MSWNDSLSRDLLEAEREELEARSKLEAIQSENDGLRARLNELRLELAGGQVPAPVGAFEVVETCSVFELSSGRTIAAHPGSHLATPALLASVSPAQREQLAFIDAASLEALVAEGKVREVR